MTPNELRKLAAEATPGPWRHVGGNVAGHEVDAVYGGPTGEQSVTRWPSSADAALIAALGPAAATILADAIDALEGVIADIDWRSSTAEDVIARFYALGNGR